MRLFARPSWCKQARPPWRLPQTTHSRVPRRIVTTSTLNSAPVDLPKLVVSPGSRHHNSLPSFLEYAERNKLPPTTPYYIGTHYEYTAAVALLRLGFSLLRTGRKSDAGIDLVGHWVLAPLREPLPVIIQCKARRTSCSPAQVRELEGSFQGIPAEWRNKNVLGLLVTTEKATKGVLEAFGQSRWPMGFVLISRAGVIQQFVWNRAASEKGLEGVGVTLRHTTRPLLPDIKEQGEEEIGWSYKGMPGRSKRKDTVSVGIDKDIQLTWMGSPIFPDRQNLDQETLKLKDVIATGEGFGEASLAQTKKTKRAVKKISTKSAKGKTASALKKTARTAAAEKTTKTTKSTKKTAVAKAKGRPQGSKNKKTILAAKENAPKKRGRPKGSKNKIPNSNAAGAG